MQYLCPRVKRGEMEETMKEANRKLVTVLTPTYNRAFCLETLFTSLCNQTNNNFLWLIVDDGSNDETEQIVKQMKLMGKVDIEYYKKNNGGKHTALNYGINMITTELTFIVDSDDKLMPNAIQTICLDYAKILTDNFCGLVYLRGYDESNVIGTYFRNDGYDNLNKVRYKQKINGDKAEVWKTQYLKCVPFITFDGEKFLGEHYVWCQLAEKYDMYFSNKIIYITEYLPDGLTNSGRKMRIKCPKGGKASSYVLLKKCYPIKIRLKNSILFICYSYLNNEKTKEIFNNKKLLIKVNILFGYILFNIWKRKYEEK